jgi:hypothetical protein
MLFKLALWCAVVLFNDGSDMQLGVSLIINMIHLTVHVYLLPLGGKPGLPSWVLNLLETGTLILTCFMSFAGFSIKFLQISQKSVEIKFNGTRYKELGESIDILNTLLVVMFVGQLCAIAVTTLQKLWVDRKKHAKRGRSISKSIVKVIQMPRTYIKRRRSRNSSAAGIDGVVVPESGDGGEAVPSMEDLRTRVSDIDRHERLAKLSTEVSAEGVDAVGGAGSEGAADTHGDEHGISSERQNPFHDSSTTRQNSLNPAFEAETKDPVQETDRLGNSTMSTADLRHSSKTSRQHAIDFATNIFAAADKNGDGTLTKTEIRKYFKANPEDKYVEANHDRPRR